MPGIIVGGMHFSGIDLATHALAGAGRALAGSPRPDPSRGTAMDDPALVKLHLNWLRSHCAPPPGLPSWGVGGPLEVQALVGEALADPNPMALAAVCEHLDEERTSNLGSWLAQDGLSAYTARVWAQATSTQLVFVYRNPWDCVDAAVRSGQTELVGDPDFVRRTWLDINRLVVEFARKYPERCTLVAAEALGRGELNVRDDSSPIAAVYRHIYPELTELLDELDDVADIPRPTSGVATLEQLVSERLLPAGTMPEGTGTQVVIVCRDDVAFLGETIASVAESAAATACEVEVTIVDDGSTDDQSLVMMQRLREAGLGVIVTPGVGRAAAHNTAISESATASVLPLGPRSRLLLPLLEGQELIASQTADVVCGPWHDVVAQSELRTPPQPTALTLFPDNPMPDTALIARTTLQALGGWDDNVTWVDWDFWLSCAERDTRIHRLAQPTFESWAGSAVAEADDMVNRELGLQAMASKHAELLSPHLGTYVAGLTAEVNGQSRALNLAKTEAVMLRSVATAANARLHTELTEARAAIARLQSELDTFHKQRHSHPTSSRPIPRHANQSRPITVEDPLLFLHVPKTGGTSFRKMLQEEFGDDLVYPSDSDLRASPRHSYPSTSRVIQRQQELPPHAVLIGHFEAHLNDALQRDYRTAVFLRDPVERTLSELAWRSLMEGRDVEFYLQRPEFLEARVANLQTRILAGRAIDEPSRISDEQLLDAALNGLSTVDFVGLTEEYFASCVRFDRLFGTSISKAIRWENVTRPDGDELAQYADDIAPYVQLDRVLYERAVARIDAEMAEPTR